ncbi:AAA domain-containing protein [Nocardia sp. NPDC051981]|uniref:DEAD/DEAH box helicase n=1 Tax=Nocardia sp. NPDC051981 TaxID=3155417 RepID=UPI003433F451
MADAEQARIVRFWRAVEYFSPQKVDSPKVRSTEVERIIKGRKLLWEAPTKPVADKFVWRYTVYAGIFDIAKIRDVLQSALPAPEPDPDHDGRINGQSALLSLTLDDSGRLYKESVTISSCAWALGRTVLPPGPGSDEWLEGFEEHSKDMLAMLFEIGDGRVPIDEAGQVESGGKRALRAIAGVTTRVALDVVTGGLASVSGLVSTVVEDQFGPVAAKVAEKVADSLTKDATQAIEKRGKKSGDDSTDAADEEDAGAADEDSEPKQLGTKVLTVEDLSAITRWVAEELGVDEILEPTEIWVKPYRVPIAHADDVSGDEIINSFYAKDLEKVSTELLSGNAGAALTSYLRSETSIDNEARIDLRQRPQEMLRSLTPQSMPLGRWPANPDHPLTLSQQFAVNRIFIELGDREARGIYAVNGPPGTGKTTMLRDLISAVIVQRAVRLAELPNPRAAFQLDSAALRWTCADGPWTRTIVPLIPELTGFEMVVASSNNGAVENITMEVPSAKAIHADTFADADYFSGPATLLAGEPCWGAVAARLGRRNNRSEFVKRFWWGNRDRSAGERNERSELFGLHKILKDLDGQGMQPDLGSWESAVTEFRAAVATVDRLTQERQQVSEIAERVATEDPTLALLRRQVADSQERITRLRDLRDELARAETESRSTKHRVEHTVADAHRAVEAADIQARGALDRLNTAEQRLYEHAGTKPGWVRRVLSLGNALPEWERTARPFLDEVENARAAAAAADQRCADREAEWHDRQRALTNAAAEVARQQQRVRQCDEALRMAGADAHRADRSARQRESEIQREAALLEDARERWTDHVPGDEWNPLDYGRATMERRERSSPWMDAEFATARSEIFIAALRLHRATLTALPELAWNNLRAVVDVVNGDAPVDLPAQKVLAAWQLLFFVVPVVSTTFASMSTMFSALGREALGWLFIDEAGQATPQAAVGALWRSQRAVVVGDPRQLEPVVTLPWPGQQRLYAKFGLSKRWAPQVTSVQSIADRVNTFGTWLSEPDSLDRIWVGSPLRVHRRCDQLMFEVSNAIAYDNLMVYGVSGRDDDFALGRSNMWVHVDARPGREKWNPEEGRQVLAILRRISRHIGEALDEEWIQPDPERTGTRRARHDEIAERLEQTVFIVSPFREVAIKLDRYLADNGMRIPRERLGTVHTTQGKEADIVILVLGTGSDEKRAREWASAKPNLLNVAVTRAKRRLVVVGDFDSWASLSNFSTLAEHTRPGGLLERWPTPAGR